MKARLPAAALMWFGLLGAPLAWATQHVTGYFLTDAKCPTQAPAAAWAFDAWTVVVGAVAAAVALAAVVSAYAAWRMTRTEPGGESPTARVHFMATMALLVAPLTLLIIVMSSVGAVVLPECVQS